MLKTKMSPGKLWPACLPKKEYNGVEGIFGGWLDQEPFYRLTTNSLLAHEKNYLTLKSVEVTETVEIKYHSDLEHSRWNTSPAKTPNG